MSPDMVAPVCLLFAAAFIVVSAGLVYYGEQWMAELDAQKEDEE